MNASFRENMRETRDAIRGGGGAGGTSMRERLSRTGSNLSQSFRKSTSNLRNRYVVCFVLLLIICCYGEYIWRKYIVYCDE